MISCSGTRELQLISRRNKFVFMLFLKMKNYHLNGAFKLISILLIFALLKNLLFYSLVICKLIFCFLLICKMVLYF